MNFAVKINSLYQNQKPFVAFRRPFENQMTLLVQNSDVLHAFSGQMGFCFVDFSSQKPIVFPLQDSQVDQYDIDIVDENFNLLDFKESHEASRNFKVLVDKALQEIHQKGFQKIVVSRALQVDFYTNLAPLSAQLFSHFPEAFVSIVYHPQIGCWVGATPELLLQNINTQYKTVALAGTVSKMKDAVHSFGSKEFKEQNVIEDYFDQQLKQYINTSYFSEPQIIKTGQVNHLKSEVFFDLKEDLDPLFLINLLHPTPAVAGLPKQKSIQWINNHEGYSRDYYAGYLGMFAPDNLELYVNLRCMTWAPEHQTLYVGCGILSGSQPEKEFIETQAKAQAMLGLLNASKYDK